MAMELEIKRGPLTITVKGKAGADVVFIGEGGHVMEPFWIDEPRIVDVHNNYYDVNLTEEEEKEILESLDINDFVE